MDSASFPLPSTAACTSLLSSDDSEEMELEPRCGCKMTICGKARKVYAWDVQDGHREEVLALPKKSREELIGPDVRKSLDSPSETRNWKIKSYRCQSRPFQDVRDDQTLIEPELLPKEPASKALPSISYQSSIKLKNPASREPEVFVCDPSPQTTFGTVQIKLPSTRYINPSSRQQELVENGKRIAVIFGRPVDISVETGEATESKVGVCYKAGNTQMNLMSHGRSEFSGDVNLLPREWAMLRFDGREWVTEYKVVSEGESFIPNPLLRESGPLIVTPDGLLLAQENDGEPYLTQEMITQIYLDKHSKIPSKERLSWFYIRSDHADARLKKLARNNFQYQFFFERWNSAHVVGVYVNLTDNNEVHVYIHETEPHDNPTAIQIRQELMARLSKIYKNQSLHFFYPKTTLQRDFAGCGAFAIKSMSHFQKHQQAMNDWMQTMKTYSTPVDMDAGDNQVFSCGIPLTEMRPGLLKMYDGRRTPPHEGAPALTEKQKSTVVNDKKRETLDQYLEKYERRIARMDGESFTTVNLGSMHKRYQYMADYQTFRDTHPAIRLRLARKRFYSPDDRGWGGNTFTVSMNTAGMPDSTNLSEYYGAPMDILLCENRDTVNTWLKQQKSSTISKDEWGIINHYYGKLSSGMPLHKYMEAFPNHAEWIESAKCKSVKKPKWFLINQWLDDCLLPLESHKPKRARSSKKTTAAPKLPEVTTVPGGSITFDCTPSKRKL